MRRNVEIWLFAGFCALACDDERREPQEWGSIAFAWSIDQRATPGACAPLGAETLEAAVFNRGMIIDRYTASCEAFAFTADPIVATDLYTVQLRLLDANNVANGPTIVSPTFTVQPNAPTVIRANFGSENRIEVASSPGGTDAAATP